MSSVETETLAKPIDEPWQARALEYVLRYRGAHQTGPTWAELRLHMRWRANFKSWRRMLSLSRRGLVWEDDTPRSLDVSDVGVAALAAWGGHKKGVAP